MKLRVLASIVAASASGCFAPTDAERPLNGPIQTGAVVAYDVSKERFAEMTVLLPVNAAESGRWITQPERLERWLAEDVEFDAVGGPFRISWPTQGISWVGKLIAIDASGRLVAEVIGQHPEKPVRLDFSTVPEVDQQRVRVVIGPFGSEMVDEVAAVGYREGMGEALATLRRAAMGEPTAPTKVPVVERVFHPLETPRAGLEAESSLKASEKDKNGKKKP